MITENFKVKTSDGVELIGVKYIPAKPRGVIYFSHGMSVPKEGPSNTLKDTAMSLVTAGFKVVAFDFRGHGLSGGVDLDVTIESGLEDLDTIIKEDNESLPIGLFGFSYGGAISIIYAAKNKLDVKAMALYSPALEFHSISFNNLNSVIGQFYKKAIDNGTFSNLGYIELPNGYKISRKFLESSKKTVAFDSLSKLNSKILIIQAINDQMLSYEKVKELGMPFADKYVSLDAVHGLVEKIDVAIDETVVWFSTYLK